MRKLPEHVINLLALRFAPVVVPEASRECNFGKLSIISQISNFSSVFFSRAINDSLSFKYSRYYQNSGDFSNKL